MPRLRLLLLQIGRQRSLELDKEKYLTVKRSEQPLSFVPSPWIFSYLKLYVIVVFKSTQETSKLASLLFELRRRGNRLS